MSRFKGLLVGLFMGSLAFAAVGGLASSVHAAQLFEDVCQKTPSATVCQEQKKKQTTDSNVLYGKNGVLMKATDLLTYVIGIVAVIIVIVSGLRYIFSSGDAGSISSAKKGIIYALVGVVIAIFARSIIAFVIYKI